MKSENTSFKEDGGFHINIIKTKIKSITISFFNIYRCKILLRF